MVPSDTGNDFGLITAADPRLTPVMFTFLAEAVPLLVMGSAIMNLLFTVPVPGTLASSSTVPAGTADVVWAGTGDETSIRVETRKTGKTRRELRITGRSFQTASL